MIVVLFDSRFISIHVHELFLNVFFIKKLIKIKNENDEDFVYYQACMPINIRWRLVIIWVNGEN